MDSETTEEQQPTGDRQPSEQGQSTDDQQSVDKGKKEETRVSRKKAGGIVAALLVVAVVVLLGIDGGWYGQLMGGETGEGADEVSGASPEIVDLSASTERILPGDTVSITCDAVDPDDDALTYDWSCSAGELTGDGAKVEWTAPGEEGLYQVLVTVADERDTSVSDSLALRVRDNAPPEILVMESDIGDEVEWVVPGTAVYIRCETEDPDGDELTLAWSASAGDIYGEGEAVIWIAPETPDTYWVTLEVEDTYGEVAKRAIPLTVNVAEPPIIHGFSLEALNTDMFRPYGDSWRIFKERSCAIHAQVDDEEGAYTYEWEADAGTLTVEGPDAEWQAPDSKGWVNIVLRVSDRHGNESTASVRVYVETCPSCM